MKTRIETFAVPACIQIIFELKPEQLKKASLSVKQRLELSSPEITAEQAILALAAIHKSEQFNKSLK